MNSFSLSYFHQQARIILTTTTYCSANEKRTHLAIGTRPSIRRAGAIIGCDLHKKRILSNIFDRYPIIHMFHYFDSQANRPLEKDSNLHQSTWNIQHLREEQTAPDQPLAHVQTFGAVQLPAFRQTGEQIAF
jgi:hypothetical protein